MDDGVKQIVDFVRSSFEGDWEGASAYYPPALGAEDVRETADGLLVTVDGVEYRIRVERA
jgi:hypothetical protein